VSRSTQEIQDWMLDRLSRLTGTPRADIDPGKPIQNYGLDSVAQVVFVTELETWLGYRFQGHAMNTLTTVEMLAAHLAKETERQSSATN
jgi:acyl carrier protein